MATFLSAACQSNPPVSTLSIDAARGEFIDLISDVTESDAHAYRVLDNLGDWLGPSVLI